MIYPKKNGFTLIELSIVLVIIGLIVGGIIGGKSLISAAAQQSLIRQAKAYKSTIRTFQDQYDAKPGDMIDATDYWPAATINGDGNGGISWNATVFFRRERLLVWQHLALADILNDAAEGIISGNTVYPGRNTPLIDGFDNGYMEYYHLGQYQMEKEAFLTNAIMTSNDAYSLDKKLDDKKAGTGKIKAFDPTGSNTCTTGNGSNPEARWLLSNTSTSCRLIMDF